MIAFPLRYREPLPLVCDPDTQGMSLHKHLLHVISITTMVQILTDAVSQVCQALLHCSGTPIKDASNILLTIFCSGGLCIRGHRSVGAQVCGAAACTLAGVRAGLGAGLRCSPGQGEAS